MLRLLTWRNLAIYTVILVLWTSVTTLYVHNKFIDADQLQITKQQLDQANKAPAAIIKFNQGLNKTNAKKESCYSTAMPDDLIKLLK